MPPQPVAPQGKALVEKARTLGIRIDDLLTADGREIAWKADKDFKAPINGVLVEFSKGDPIRDWPLIAELRKGRCPVTSLESELWQRIALAQAAKPPMDVAAISRTLGLGPTTAAEALIDLGEPSAASAARGLGLSSVPAMPFDKPVQSAPTQLAQPTADKQRAPLIDSFTIFGVRISAPEAQRRARQLLQRGLAWLQRRLDRSS
jgi:hypothetical protein